jgi:hypothetical protein
MKKINFVSFGGPDMASYRYRTAKPIELLETLVDKYEVSLREFADLSADINIFGKHLEPDATIWNMKKAKKAGSVVAFDVCDDHFDREAKRFYNDACSLADILICTNERMEKRLRELFPDKKIFVAFDPINTLAGEPRWSEKPRFIWYGHSSNFNDAAPFFKEAVDLGLDLTVFSNMNVESSKFKFVPFQNGLLEERLRKYDIVLLPTGTAPWITMKSENRYVDALNAGCFVFSTPCDLYKDLEKYGSTVRDGGLEWSLRMYLENKDEVLNKIKEGQETVVSKYNDNVLREQWRKIVDDKA